MNKRQKEVAQAHLDNEKAVLKKLEKNYQDALDEINDKIAILLARQDADMQHVIYQVEYQKALKAQVQAILENLQSNEFETVSEYLTKSYEEGFLGTMYDLHGQGIPLVMPMDQEQIVAAIQHETKLSENLYNSLGKDIKLLNKQIAGEISRGIATGMMYGEIARNIASWGRIPKNNAMRITRTESHRIQCKASMDACEKAKSKGADVVKQWDSSLDKRTRDSHVKLDGEIKELDEKFSNGLMYPGDPNGTAAEVINCRCSLLQRARWNLGSDYTKWSHDAPVMISDDGTTQLTVIEAKNYEDFKKKYNKATERVRENVQKKKGEVALLDKYTVDGITYTVDGKHVVLDNTEHEREVAKLISEEIGEKVSLVPRVVFPQGVSTPDYIIGDKKYDLKEPIGSGKNVLYNMVHKKKSQANNFIFDISKCPLDYETINKQIEELYSSKHTSFIDEIIVIQDGKIKKKFSKQKSN